jgi:hypothetical protein
MIGMVLPDDLIKMIMRLQFNVSLEKMMYAVAVAVALVVVVLWYWLLLIWLIHTSFLDGFVRVPSESTTTIGLERYWLSGNTFNNEDVDPFGSATVVVVPDGDDRCISCERNYVDNEGDDGDDIFDKCVILSFATIDDNDDDGGDRRFDCGCWIGVWL